MVFETIASAVGLPGRSSRVGQSIEPGSVLRTVPEVASEEPPVPDERPDHQSDRRRVVVAEDEALIRLDLVEMLGEEGYEVVAAAADGESAVRLAEEHRPDLVILDVKMPILDGITAAER